MTRSAVKIKVFGYVQGVGFRYSLAQLAKDLNLVGWAKNSRDGGFECLAEGQKDNLDKLVFYCHQGPPWAKVDEIQVEWLEPSNQFKEFKIIYI